MTISAGVLVLADGPPRVTWTGSRQEAAEFCRLEVKERLSRLATSCRLESLARPCPAVKDRLKAERLRQAGMSLVKETKFVEAVLEFNTAIRLVPPTEKELIGWICAGRSLATWSLDFNQESYEDCVEALELLPSSFVVQRVKLWERLALCRPDKLNLATISIRKELDVSSLEDKMKERLVESVGLTLKTVRCVRSRRSRSPPRLEEAGRNRFVSRKVEVAVGEKVRRHVVARQDIEVGEVIVEERPISSVLHLARLATNCSTCLRSVVRGLGCDGCTEVIFCCGRCRDQARQGYHRLECGNLHLLPPTGPLATTLRLFTNKTARYFLDRKSLFDRHDPDAGWETQADSSGDDYDSLLRAAYNMQVCDKNLDYQMDMTITAYYYLHCLHQMGFFADGGDGGGKTEMCDDSSLYIGSLLYHLLRGVEENSHEIVQFDDPGPEYCGTLDSLYDGGEAVISVIGGALNSICSLFNNSCDVNTVKYHQGDQTVMIARRRILAGEEVTDFYGAHYFQSSRGERQAMLGFPCQCRPCSDNWPLLRNLQTFTKAQLKQRAQWCSAREQLDTSVSNMKVLQTFKLSKQLAETVGVKSPHESLIIPELYLHYSSVFLYGNKSLPFRVFADQVMANEEKSAGAAARRKTKK